MQEAHGRGDAAPNHLNFERIQEMTIKDDDEIRNMTIALLKRRTARDDQRRIGASNLSNGCDHCLAHNFLGNDRATPITDRAWMGKTWGTAQHSLLEQRINEALYFDGLDAEGRETAREMVETMLGLDPDAKAEEHVFFAEISGYGRVGGTIDLLLPEQTVDWKGTTRKKLCVFIDFVEINKGNEAPYGRKHAHVKLSEAEYAKEMLAMKYKYTGYVGQQTLYMKGAGVTHASLVFLSRDGTGVFDNPNGARYVDRTAVHDVHVTSFDYNPAYADALIARGQAIWDYLEGGGTPAELQSHEQCFACGQDQQDAARAAAAPPDINIEATFEMAA